MGQRRHMCQKHRVWSLKKSNNKKMNVFLMLLVCLESLLNSERMDVYLMIFFVIGNLSWVYFLHVVFCLFQQQSQCALYSSICKMIQLTPFCLVQLNSIERSSQYLAIAILTLLHKASVFSTLESTVFGTQTIYISFNADCWQIS